MRKFHPQKTQYLCSKDDKCQKRDEFLNDNMMGICILIFYNHKFTKLFHKYRGSYYFILINYLHLNLNLFYHQIAR